MNGMRAYRWRSQRLSQFCRVESESFCLAPPVLEVAAEVQARAAADAHDGGIEVAAIQGDLGIQQGRHPLKKFIWTLSSISAEQYLHQCWCFRKRTQRNMAPAGQTGKPDPGPEE